MTVLRVLFLHRTRIPTQEERSPEMRSLRRKIGKREIWMKNPFYPDEWTGSTYEIDFEHYYREGYRAVIFDIDNTLVPHGAPADERSIALFRRLHGLGYRTLLLSNNKEPRVKPFAETVEADYICKAGKPAVKNYLEACDRMGVGKEHTLFVGDQLFTDVWGAGRAGIRTILVSPINPREEIQIVLKRYLEKPVLYFYRKKRKKEHEKH